MWFPVDIPARTAGVVPLLTPSRRIVAPDGVDVTEIDPVEGIRVTVRLVIFPGFTEIFIG